MNINDPFVKTLIFGILYLLIGVILSVIVTPKFPEERRIYLTIENWIAKWPIYLGMVLALTLFNFKHRGGEE